MDVLGIALFGQNPGSGRHVADVVDELCSLRSIVEVVPHGVRLPGDDGRQQARPAADLELDLRAQARQYSAGKIGIKPDDVVKILGIAGAVRGTLAVLANPERFASDTWILTRKR